MQLMYLLNCLSFHQRLCVRSSLLHARTNYIERPTKKRRWPSSGFSAGHPGADPTCLSHTAQSRNQRGNASSAKINTLSAIHDGPSEKRQSVTILGYTNQNRLPSDSGSKLLSLEPPPLLDPRQHLILDDPGLSDRPYLHLGAPSSRHRPVRI